MAAMLSVLEPVGTAPAVTMTACSRGLGDDGA